MRIKLDVHKSLEENAASLFEVAKKAKRKSIGAKDAVTRLSTSDIAVKDKKKQLKSVIKKTHWFMKYRWFFTSEGNLAIGGKDADTNEEIIKKRVEPYDLIFHAEIPGSPFFVLKGSKGIVFTENEKQSVANATASYSRAWKYGVAFVDVFCVLPNQVSKKARAGEYVSKGAFMIHGKKEFYKGELELTLSLHMIGDDEFVMSSGENNKNGFAILKTGSMKASDVAKKISEIVKTIRNDIIIEDINPLIPGPSEIMKID
jgi:predicted ribosome quality control (RQC) complex YloA/Tae2 family protein